MNYFKRRKERKRLDQEVPFTIDLLTLTLQSGLSLPAALEYISRDEQSLISEKIRQALNLINLGKSLTEVLEYLKDEVDHEDFSNLITHLLQAKKLGVPLSSTLEMQSKIIRTRKRQRAEELSRTASVKITLPLVLFIFPALLIIYLGPGLIHLMTH